MSGQSEEERHDELPAGCAVQLVAALHVGLHWPAPRIPTGVRGWLGLGCPLVLHVDVLLLSHGHHSTSLNTVVIAVLP